MKARPIIFSGPMVRALLDGQKHQTRRVVKGLGEDHSLDSSRGRALSEGFAWFTDRDDMPGNFLRVCPYGKPGDLLYVREAWRTGAINDPDPPRYLLLRTSPVYYLADGEPPQAAGSGRYRHARFMPRWASRLTLQLTEVRVERVEQVTGRDAMKEGALAWAAEHDPAYAHEDSTGARIAFRVLWEFIHGSGSWERNDWVWALSFRVIHANVDDVLADPAAYGVA